MAQFDHRSAVRIVKRTPALLAALVLAGALVWAAISLAGGSERPRITIVSTGIECRAGVPVQLVRVRNRGGGSVRVEASATLKRSGETVATSARTGRVGRSVRTFRLDLGAPAAEEMPFCRLLSGSSISGRVSARRGSARQTLRFGRTGGPQRALTSRITQLGAVPAPVSEASGLVESRRRPGTFWTHDDSGGAASLYALDASTGLIAEQPLSGVANTDWEDIAIGPGESSASDHLYVGDIGDNNGVRPRISIHRIPEPDPTGAGASLPPADPETLSLVYPDGARDAEALVVDPVDGDVFLITKRESLSRVYVARNPTFASGGDQTLEFVGELDTGNVVAADACPDGQTVLVKTYFGISAYVDSDGVEDALTTQTGKPRLYSIDSGFPQDESVAADPYCTGYSTLPEGSGAPLRRFTP